MIVDSLLDFVISNIDQYEENLIGFPHQNIREILSSFSFSLTRDKSLAETRCHWLVRKIAVLFNNST